MKAMLFGLLLLLGFVGSSPGIGKPELDDRIRTLTAKFEAMQSKPDKRIPADYLRRAQGIVLLDRTKAGVIFAYQGGSGVAMVRNPETEQWSPVAFLNADEASLGFQAGGEQNFFVMLLMDTNATRLLTEPSFEFGGEAQGTAGDKSAVEGAQIAAPERSVLVYDDRQGLYAGATVKGGAVKPDNEANRVYYEKFVTMRDVLSGQRLSPSEAASALAAQLNDYSRSPEKITAPTR